MVIAYLSLGSNLGDREAHVASAIRALDETPGVHVRAVSSWIETEPVGGPAGQGPYLNGACALEVSPDLTAQALLVRLLEIERSCGRVRHEQDERWGPRPLDLDLLLFGEALIDEPGLTVPHPRMHERAFVLAPLAEIAPQARHPRLRQTAGELLSALSEKLSHA